VTTEDVSSPGQARQTIVARLRAGGISRAAITRGISLVLKGRSSMRGAALIRAESGERCEPDTERGIRVSRLGMEKASRQRLSRVLAHLGINTQTVREALVLASKTASCPGVVAELCVSDDPDYTTGYVSSRDMGYVRVPSVKRCGSLSGGRIFFIGEDADPARIVDYLEKAPVLAWLP
jgi:6-carboxyhexanoate--CoA ligase